MTPDRLGLLWGITVFAGACARLLAALSGLQAVVLLLLSGLLIGRSAWDWWNHWTLASGWKQLSGCWSACSVRRWSEPATAWRHDHATVLRISLLRLVLSFGAAMLAAHWLAGLGWSLSAVYSAIVLSTGPTVVTPIVQQIRLARLWASVRGGRSRARTRWCCLGIAAAGAAVG